MATTAEYRQYLLSPEWDDRRRTALRRAGYRCEKCGKAKPLQVHHLTYERIFNEPQADLQALCFSCHRWIHAGLLKRAWIIAGKILRRVIE
jgi:5-methylcytosine-specific restriction endonuclease McrA